MINAEVSGAEARFAKLIDALAGSDGLTLGGGGRGFGSGALKVNGRIFAMLKDGHLVLKLPSERVLALVSRRDGTAFDAGKGKPMKEWVMLLPTSQRRWLPLAREALAYVSRGP